MAAKFILAVCAQFVILQCVLSQCIGRGPIIGPGISPYGPYDGLGIGPGPGCGCGVASTGGGFPVTSASPIAPTGITLVSENAIEGSLVIGGNLPFLATVALEGILPTAGSGAVSYGCGDGAIGIVSEGPTATGIVGPSSYPPGLPAGPYGPGVGPIGPAGAYGPGLGPVGPAGAFGPGLGPVGPAGAFGPGLGPVGPAGAFGPGLGPVGNAGAYGPGFIGAPYAGYGIGCGGIY